MTPITLSDLYPFQVRVAGALGSMIQEYPSERFKPRFDQDTGERLPFLCRLSAITGAGKTPILAYAASLLSNSIILWTTNRGAVVSQTWANLQSDGKYGQLLPSDTGIYNLGDMSPGDWEAMINADRGLTILLATVASFNQEGDALKIHREYGDTTRWRMLGDASSGGRARPLYVFYDEGHGATQQQFDKLRELSPKAFVLASASPLPEDLSDLIPGKSADEKARALQDRTVVVPTTAVVEAGLLKKRLYFMDCDITQADAVREANEKWETLLTKLAPYDETPIACFIVNETTRGVDIWEHLVKLGVNKSRIAVHLNGAADVMRDRHGSLMGLLDTYTGKKTEDRSPQALKAQGYTHLIWNLTLREGWDEPLAYVGYIDDRGRSMTDMVQKIGRFLRQPNATTFDDPDLNAAYFYFKVTDAEFASLIRDTQETMEIDGYEVIPSSGGTVPNSRTEEVVRPQATPKISPWFGEDVKERDEIVLENVTLFAEAALQSAGSVTTRVIDMAQLQEDEQQRVEEQRDRNDVVTVWQYIEARLARIDSRLIDDHGSVFSPNLYEHPKMVQEMHYNSDAMRTLDKAIEPMRRQLGELLQLVDEGSYDLFTTKPFKLTSPDITGVTDAQREKYRVRRYNNAVHAHYNGLNPFEVQVADALDALGKPWCRNPPIKSSGYRIPIPQLGADTIWFYPDFLLWADKEVWAIDPKGRHLLEAAVQSKLLYLSTSTTPTLPVRVALVLDGEYTRDDESRWSKSGKKGGYTLVRRVGGEIKTRSMDNPAEMMKALLGKK